MTKVQLLIINGKLLKTTGNKVLMPNRESKDVKTSEGYQVKVSSGDKVKCY